MLVGLCWTKQLNTTEVAEDGNNKENSYTRIVSATVMSVESTTIGESEETEKAKEEQVNKFMI